MLRQVDASRRLARRPSARTGSSRELCKLECETQCALEHSEQARGVRVELRQEQLERQLEHRARQRLLLVRRLQLLLLLEVVVVVATRERMLLPRAAAAARLLCSFSWLSTAKARALRRRVENDVSDLLTQNLKSKAHEEVR